VIRTGPEWGYYFK